MLLGWKDKKTAAFEVIEQLSYHVPDAVIVPIGCGTNITAYGKGFAEYEQLGFTTTHAPRLLGVQATGASAVVNSFSRGEDNITRLAHCDTIASAIAVPDPIDGNKALAAIRATDGAAYAVDDAAILAAQTMLAIEEGLFVESASAATVACLLAQSHILQHKTVVCVLTGEGLKDAHVVMQAAAEPPTIGADVHAFDHWYQDEHLQHVA